MLGLVALRGNSHVGALVVLLIGILTLGWAVMPLFFPTGDETLDPTRLVMLPLRPRPLIVSLLVASLVGIGPVFTLALVVGSVIAVADGPVAAVAGRHGHRPGGAGVRVPGARGRHGLGAAADQPPRPRSRRAERPVHRRSAPRA